MEIGFEPFGGDQGPTAKGVEGTGITVVGVPFPLPMGTGVKGSSVM